MSVETLGRYRIERELGRGAMGRVFLAYDTKLERRVAIKTIHAFESLPAADRLEARERFLREARAAGGLLHPGIVTIFDVGESDGIPYLAMEHVSGTTLDAYGREGELLPPATVAGLVAHAAEALAFAHTRGVVHRDVKPANLMRVGTTAIKVMDFGLAKSVAAKVTHDGALFGTPNYMSPEQVRGETVDGRSDLFSLGVVLYEMLLGTKPFGGDSVSSVLYRIVNEPARGIPINVDRIPGPLASIVERALAKRREDRFADGLELAAALRRAIAAKETVPAPVARTRPRPGAPLPAPQPPALDRTLPPPPVARRRSPFPYVVAGVLLAAAAGAALLLAGGRSGAPALPPLEARVRTEPAGLTVLFDGAPLDGGELRFDAHGPFGLLSAASGCRRAEHRIEPADAGREIVLVLDPAQAQVEVPASVPGSSASVNGSGPVPLPASIDLDLCRDNRVEVRAPGHRDAIAVVPAQATPLAARSTISAIRPEPIPLGRLVLPALDLPVQLTVDGQPVARTRRTIEIAAGAHEVRVRNDDHFVDLAVSVDVPADGSASARLAIPPLATLVVQTFPPEAKVALSRDGGAWRGVGESPLRHRVAAGEYRVRVEDPATGASREERVQLRAGSNPPVRVSFGEGRR